MRHLSLSSLIRCFFATACLMTPAFSEGARTFSSADGTKSFNGYPAHRNE
jgi:hypothetical protein